MIEEKIPRYIIELKDDLIKHFDTRIKFEINELAIMINDTFATKEDLSELKNDIGELRNELKEEINDLRIETRKGFKEIHAVIGSYEVRSKNIEDILLEDHKPRIVDLEKEVFRI